MHHPPHHAPDKTLGIREAARRLGLAHTTVGRYVRAFPDLNRGSKGRPRVDLDELRRHRAANLNPTVRGVPDGKLLAEGGATAGSSKAGPASATGTDAPSDFANSRAMREAVLAKRAQIDLDEKRALLVPRAEVEDAIHAAAVTLQQALLELGGQLADRLAAMVDAREIATLMETEHRRLLTTLAASLRSPATEEENHTSAEVVQLHQGD